MSCAGPSAQQMPALLPASTCICEAQVHLGKAPSRPHLTNTSRCSSPHPETSRWLSQMDGAQQASLPATNEQCCGTAISYGLDQQTAP